MSDVKDLLNQITPEFIAQFKIELELVGYKYRECGFFCGTVKWNNAFKQCCEKSNIVDLYHLYSELDWMESDNFDAMVCDLLTKNSAPIVVGLLSSL